MNKADAGIEIDISDAQNKDEKQPSNNVSMKLDIDALYGGRVGSIGVDTYGS